MDNSGFTPFEAVLPLCKFSHPFILCSSIAFLINVCTLFVFFDRWVGEEFVDPDKESFT